MKSVEAIFGGVLALVILGAAIFMLAGGDWGGGGTPPPDGTVVIQPAPDDPSGGTTNSALCQCFDQGFDLAGKNADVMSSQYRTGFESCRAVLGPKGGDAWTAGWNARLSSKPFMSSCGAWLKRS